MKINPETGTVIQRPAVPAIPLAGKRKLGNWIHAFLDYTDQAESPVDYLRWTALATIAGAAQRKVYMDMEYFFVHSNMYVVLVGPPGSKKSTAIRQGRKLLAKVPGINLTSDAPSVPGIMEDFKDVVKVNSAHQSLNSFIYELSSLYENAPEAMTGFLTAIYDGDADYIKRTRVAGREHIPFPWLNFLAATTPTWLGDNISRSALEGGLVARTLYVYSDEVILKSPWFEFDPKYARLREDLIHDLAHISQLNFEFKFAGGSKGEAAQFYKAWYLDRERFPKITDNRTAGYFVRKPIHLLKVAMALSLAESDEPFLELRHLELAMALLASIEANMARTFSSVGGNTQATELERIELQIRQSGNDGITKAELIQGNKHNLDLRALDQILETLKAMESVTVRTRILNGGRDVEQVYIAT